LAHNWLGHALLQKGQLDEASAAFREVIRIRIRLKTDKTFGGHVNLGYALYWKGQLDEAIAEYREGLRLTKDHKFNATIHRYLGIALRDKGQLDEAIAECRESIRLKQDYPWAHHNLGSALQDKGQLDEAIAAYREAIRLQQSVHGPHRDLGTALWQKGQLDEAITELQEAIRLQKEFTTADGRQVLNLEQCPSYREALRTFWQNNDDQLEEGVLDHWLGLRVKKENGLAHNHLGLALRDKGRLNEAVAAYQEAIRLQEDFAEAHCNLGQALVAQGRFRQAVEELRRGHALGSRDPHWPHPSAQWLRQAERLVELEPRLPRLLQGKEQPVDTGERLALAYLQRHREHYTAAARWYAAAFADDTKLTADPATGHRYYAACAAALAGCLQGQDTVRLEEKERARLRGQALDWLRADLEAWRRALKKVRDKVRPVVVQQMQHWLGDPDFTGVRGPEALARLPEAERRDWQQFWREVEDLRQRAAGPLKTATPARP
jgi:tetratricopeptide (TPR) repeat protein